MELEFKNTHSLEDFWSVRDDDEFVAHLERYLSFKKFHRQLPLSTPEQNIVDLVNLYALICMEGFGDLFCHRGSLANCVLLATFLHELGLHQLAGWWEEGTAIYCHHRTDLTEEEYREQESFSLSEEEGQRLDKIEELFIGDESELFDPRWRTQVRAFANQHRSEIT